MALIWLYMTVSLDGYVVGPRDSVDTPMGVDGFRLFNWDVWSHVVPRSSADDVVNTRLVSCHRVLQAEDRSSLVSFPARTDLQTAMYGGIGGLASGSPVRST